MNTIESIIPYLCDIAIIMGTISICYALWIQGRYYGEDLTMEEKPIKPRLSKAVDCRDRHSARCRQHRVRHQV